MKSLQLIYSALIYQKLVRVPLYILMGHVMTDDGIEMGLFFLF